MSHTQIDFPFSAVQGQSSFKKALILAAINPAIGGVLVAGPRGSAKSTLARALASILPVVDDAASPFVTLPLATSLEMLTGTLDIEQVLNDKKLTFSPGLLSKANGGILYVDEVNLLPDHLVDQLLDVAASGINRVERDGVSHTHESVFSLIGTMNPDEGELRSQLKDRFGLMVQLDASVSLNDRVEIVRARETFDVNRSEFIEKYREQQQQLADKIVAARAHLSEVNCTEALRIEIAQRCFNAGVEGLRADLVMYRAAVAHCAWRGAQDVDLADIDAVENFVLTHRRTVPQNLQTQDQNTQDKEPPSDDSNGGDSNNGGHPKNSPPENNRASGSNAFRRPSNTHSTGSSASTNTQREQQPSGDWGQMQVPQQTKASTEAFTGVTQLLEKLLDSQQLTDKSTLNQTLSTSKAAANHSRSNINTDDSDNINKKQGAINWFATVQQSFKQWPALSVQYQQKKQVANRLHLVLLDTSASTLTEQLSARAKACVLTVCKAAYLQREQIQILGFGNQNIAQIMAKVKAPKELEQVLNRVDVGGGTPLREVLTQAKGIVTPLLKQQSVSEVSCYLVTDGRSRADVADLSLGVPTVLIDTENSSVKRGRGALIATQLKAHYLSLAQWVIPAKNVHPASGALS